MMIKPDWLNRQNIRISLDARPLLAAGQHPLDCVISETGSFGSGEIYEIITPFFPAPMIEKFSARGFNSFTEQDSEGAFRTFFCKV
ncbi:MAG: hypothetical protein NTX61_00715 [Bacteroidetes bacterium]|nr:hypothetical protein [Bacteroidota bacterium]